MISANVARCQSDLAKEQLILLQTDEILKAVETMIDEEISCGRTSIVFTAHEEYSKEAFLQVGELLKEEGYHYVFVYDPYDRETIVRLLVSWEEKNPYKEND
jgi:hypothetical protein